jgi:hypothetical protein
LIEALTRLYPGEETKIVPIADKLWVERNLEFERTAVWIQTNKMYPSQQRRFSHSLEGIERVRVRQLPYWSYHFSSPRIASERSSKVARNFHSHLIANGWKCVDKSDAMSALKTALSQANSTIRDIGEIIHRYYHLD